MTLLEVVVALTVAGTALVAGASTLGFLADQQQRAATETLAAAHAERAALRDWIAEARLATEGDAVFQGGADSLVFVTSAPTPVSATGTVVRLTLDPALVAELRPWRTAGEVMRLPLADSARLELRYLASVEGERHWQKEWTSTSVLPAAVEVRVKFFPDDVVSARRALLAIPMTILMAGRR